MKHIFNLILFTLLSTSLLFSQDQSIKNGGLYCSQKKSSMQSVNRGIMSPNSPKHRFDVQNYTLSFDLYDNFQVPYSQEFTATGIITFKVDTALDMIKLNAVNSSLVIQDVGLAGSTYTHDDDTLAITLDRTYNPGEIVNVSVEYQHLNVEDGHFYCSGGYVFTDNEPEGARYWYPCYDKPSDKATVNITAKVPSNVLLGSNGRLADSTTVADTTWFHWISADPVATYLVVLSARVNWNLDIVYWPRPSNPEDPMPIRFYYADGENPFGMEAIITQMADWFSEHYGEHPFEKDGFASLNSEFTWGGMENQTLTSLCHGCWYESLICHEFAHQWFGDMISPGTWADLWLNEGFANWSESLWWERDGGYAAYKEDVDNNAQYYLNANPGWPIYNPEWIVHTPDNDTLFNYAITYAKSCCIIHLLRYTLEDELFFPAIYDYATDTVNFKYKNTITDDFEAKLEESTGEDLEWFFSSWVKQPNHPVYENEYSFHDNGNGTWNVNFYVNQVQTNAGFFPIPIELTIFFNDASDTVVRVMNDVNQQLFNFSFEKEPIQLFFDRDNEIVLKEASLSVGIDDHEIDGQVFNLEQNYPNPVLNNTAITYSTPVSGHVSLKIFSITGQLVQTLVEGDLPGGTHVIDTDLSSLLPGVYLYRLDMEDRSMTKRFVKVR